MAEGPADAAWLKLGAEPGLCATCKHAKLNETRRGTVYLRCTRAAWDARLPRYPRLPVTQCVGFEPVSGSLGAQQQGGGSTRGDAPGQRGDEIG
jgi:propionyl-CoA synthetase